MKFISANIGFITNSSSCVHCFPIDLLDDPNVVAIIEAYNLSVGYLPDNLADRGVCDSVLVSKEQKEEVLKYVSGQDYFDHDQWKNALLEPDSVVITYGDESESLARELCKALSAAQTKRNDTRGFSFDFH